MPSSHLILCHPLLCPQSLPASGSFQMSQLFASGGQSIGVTASASVFPMNTQDRSSLGWTGWISLQSKGFSGVFSSTTFRKHHFFSSQPSLWSSSHICTWLLEKPYLYLLNIFSLCAFVIGKPTSGALLAHVRLILVGRAVFS